MLFLINLLVVCVIIFFMLFTGIMIYEVFQMNLISGMVLLSVVLASLCITVLITFV